MMIDWNKVDELRDEIGAEDFGEIVECFLEEVEGELSALGVKAESELGASMHYLKGSALNLGFSDFAALCQEGETQAASGAAGEIDLAGIQNCYQKSKDTFLSALGG